MEDNYTKDFLSANSCGDGAISFTVGENDDGKLLKVFLKSACGVSTRTFTKLKKIPLGITRKGQLIKADEKVFAGDEIVLKQVSEDNNIIPVKGSLDIVYEDSHIIIINKPASTPVHPTKIHQENTLANFLRYYSLEKGEDYTFRAVNRLDKDTSGLVLIAKDRHSAGILQKQDIYKEYIAVCTGITPEKGTIDKPIKKSENSNMLRIISDDGDRAVTHFERIGCFYNSSLVKLWLETGRTHQIRCHMSSIGHPLEGDDLYGGSLEKIERQALHCAKMKFFHPIDGKVMELCCDIPEDMKKIINTMNLYEINIE